MKTNHFTILLILCFLGGFGITTAQQFPAEKKIIPSQEKVHPYEKKDFNKDRTNYFLKKFRNPDSKIVLDSIYQYYWSQASFFWELNGKTYNTFNTQGNIVQSIEYYYNWWKWRTLYEYPGTNSYPHGETFQIWDDISSKWIIIGYTHYLKENQMDENSYKEWDSQNQKYRGGQRDTMWYDLSGNQTGLIYQVFDTITQTFINNFRWSGVFNNTGEQIESLYQNWDNVSHVWINTLKYTWSTDTINHITEGNEYTWDNSSSIWTNSSKIKTTSTKDYEHSEYWNFDLSEWDSLSRSYFTYSTEGKMINSLYQYYDSTSTWVNAENIYFSYYPSGNNKEQGNQSWNSSTSQWVTYNYQYFKDDSIQACLEDYWKDYDHLTYQCTGGYREQYSFDENDNLIEEIWQNWSTFSNGWVNNYKLISTYNSLNLIVEWMEQDWDTTQNIWYNRFKSLYYYSDFIGIPERSSGQRPCIFANPISFGEKIECPTFKNGKDYRLSLIDLSGKVVFISDFKGEGPAIINKFLAQGLYLLQINENGRMIYCDKIIFR